MRRLRLWADILAGIILVVLLLSQISNAIAGISSDTTARVKSLAVTTASKLYFPIIVKNYLPPPPPPPPPPWTTSRYVVTTDRNSLNRAGCNQGRAGESGVVILDFGYPVYNTSTGQYGTRLLDASNAYVSFDDIEWLVTEFLQGYYTCATVQGQHIVLALGVNNHPRYGGVIPAHGQIWGQVVDDIVDFINYPPSMSDKISAAAAVDIEFSWNSSAATRNWLDAYQPAYRNPIYNFGSCDSCPWSGGTNWVPANGWTYEDIYYVSYDASLAWPLPEIYKTNGQHSDQWQRVSKYGYTAHSSAMRFMGSMTQWYACQDTDPGACAANMTNNSPAQGWTQLWQALNADPATHQDLQWSTDIRWNTENVR